MCIRTPWRFSSKLTMAAQGYPRWKYSFNSFSLSTELAALFETWLKLSWRDWWQRFALEGHSPPHEMQNILGNLSEFSHMPRKKYTKLLVPTPPSFSARAYFWCFNLQQHSFNCSNSFWKFAATISNLQQLYSICSNFILFAATLFYLHQLCFICSNVFKFAAILFYLQQLFNLQHVPCGPPYSGYVNVTRDTSNVSYISSNQWGKTICHLRSRNRDMVYMQYLNPWLF